jgi:hypothetical protein
MKRRISILGSTGTIGRQALEVIERLKDKFEIIALTGGANIDLFLNTINHVCQSDSSPAIRSKVLLSQSISVSEFASLISFIIFVIIIPFIVIASGILVIYKRKTR